MISILIIAALVYLALSSGKRKEEPAVIVEETPGGILGNMITAIFFTFLAIAIILATVSIVAPLDKLQP